MTTIVAPWSLLPAGPPVTWRMMLIIAVLGFPLLFGIMFCGLRLMDGPDARMIMSLIAEAFALTLCAIVTYRSLCWLRDRRFMRPGPAHLYLVYGVSAYYIMMIAVTLMNADTVGLLSKGGRLDFYFQNDWYRRLVTFSYMPLAMSTFLSLHGLLSPHFKGRRGAYVLNLLLLMFASLIWGSKGAAILSIAAALGFVYSLRKLPVLAISAFTGLAGAAYIALFLLFTSDKYMSLLGIVQRFYLSIDMTILLKDRGTSDLLAARLGDVWTEVFRNLSAFGVRISDSAIGSMVYDLSRTVASNTGANCRYASLLILYPDRLDFLLGYPLLVLATAYLLREALISLRLDWAAMLAVPLFLFQSFQDVYWYSAHFAPVVLLFLLTHAAKAIPREAVSRPAHSQ